MEKILDLVQEAGVEKEFAKDKYAWVFEGDETIVITIHESEFFDNVAIIDIAKKQKEAIAGGRSKVFHTKLKAYGVFLMKCYLNSKQLTKKILL